ncbi:MAG TPA: hypothetical protein VM580_24485, partial [Labilithrix sp.]|nr:hypothetical protein [Labilithrix sp.]
MTERQKIGPHEIWQEPETKIVVMVYHGAVDETHARAVVDALSDYRKALPATEPLLVLSDLRDHRGL